MPYPTKFEVGKTYEIHHSRKGPMTIKVENIGEFTDCTIVSGHAKAMNGGAVAVAGETLTFRTSLATIKREVVSA